MKVERNNEDKLKKLQEKHTQDIKVLKTRIAGKKYNHSKLLSIYLITCICICSNKVTFKKLIRFFLLGIIEV